MCLPTIWTSKTHYETLEGSQAKNIIIVPVMFVEGFPEGNFTEFF